MNIEKFKPRVLSLLGHRGVFAVAMIELAEQYKNLAVITADLGSLSGLEKFKNVFPDKFYNVGIAEQNMIGIASGMAKEGRLVFATTYANFITMRSYEQIRMNLGYMGFNVKIVGTGGGLAMGMSGNSHYGIEDVALMRALPGMTIISPCDGMEIIKTLFAAAEYKGPIYIRLTGAMNSPIVHTVDYDFKIGKAITMKEGKDITIIATGTMTYVSLEAAKILETKGVSATVINMHTIKPIDTEIIDKACSESSLIVTVEEHSIVGGLGGAVAEYKSSLKNTPPQLFIGLPDKFGKVGEYGFLLEKYRLTPDKIAETILEKMK